MRPMGDKETLNSTNIFTMMATGEVEMISHADYSTLTKGLDVDTLHRHPCMSNDPFLLRFCNCMPIRRYDFEPSLQFYRNHLDSVVLFVRGVII